MDWLPTLADYCGLDTSDLALDGRSLTDVIGGDAPSPHTALHWTLATQWAARQDAWKMISRGDTMFLANLHDDPGESRNLANDRPDIISRLRARHEAWVATGIKPIYTVESPR